MNTDTKSIEQLCVDVIRGLSVDMVEHAKSGHPGLPLGCAPMIYTLWSKHLSHHPKNPSWFNRDRFILSAGHGSALLYSMLHLSGYDLSLEELKHFRQWESKTPGHPENGLTPGVEMATGPLGQGISTAVGMALAERYLSALYNRPALQLIDHYTYVLCSDGDLMEGVACEATSFAGHQGLGKLIVLYDDNKITIDGQTSKAFSEDTAKKFEALGWQVISITDGNDISAIDQAIVNAKMDANRPSLIICKTMIGYGSPTKAGTSKVHGAPLGEEELRGTKRSLGLPVDQDFWIPEQVADFFQSLLEKGKLLEQQWNKDLQLYQEQYPEEGRRFLSTLRGELSRDWIKALPYFEEPIATRNASQEVLNCIAPHLPHLVGGSADLASSVLTDLKAYAEMTSATPEGRNIRFGVREHAMAAIVNGIVLHAGCRAYGGTFLIFSDYCRPALRLSALMKCPSIFVFSHDSIGLGEDGPTHQPIEQAMSLRLIPNFHVMRPADGNETAVCWKLALESRGTPSALLLTRQNVPLVAPRASENHPAEKGAYILKEGSSTKLDVILIATGSEVQVALETQKDLEKRGMVTRVVSMPCSSIFDLQSEEYQEQVLPLEAFTVSIEAGVTAGWGEYSDIHIGIDHFGASAPGPKLMKEFGITAEEVTKAVLYYIEEHAV